MTRQPPHEAGNEVARAPAPQGTIAVFDAETRSGSVLQDDGARIDFISNALSEEIRLLRPGQRVRWTTNNEDTIDYLTLITLPLPSP